MGWELVKGSWFKKSSWTSGALQEYKNRAGLVGNILSYVKKIIANAYYEINPVQFSSSLQLQFVYRYLFFVPFNVHACKYIIIM